MSSSAAITRRRMATLTGIATSRGFVSGPVFLFTAGDGDLTVPEYVVDEGRIESEIERFHAARAETRRQIEEIAARVEDASTAGVFANHLAILDDEVVLSQIDAVIRNERLNAEAAVRQVVGFFHERFRHMNDPYLRERVRDIEDVERRFLRVLLGREETVLSSIKVPSIIVADDLSPSESVSLPREMVLGIATDRGSATSHVALLSRALGVPTVVGLGDVTQRVRPGDNMLLDGSNGTVTINPDAATAADFEKLVKREKELRVLIEEDRQLPGAMKDGSPLRVLANIQPGVPFGQLMAFGAQGVGLYRTEFLWIGSDHEPTEEEQFDAYSEAVRSVLPAMGSDARITFRCLDIGGDKIMRGARITEANPFLGNRSVRWLLGHRDVFRTQLRAILRASAFGKVSVMFPMIATAGELRECNAELDKVRAELEREGVAFDGDILRGAMIETPAAAMCADQLASQVDFFSIGTNDLVQYTMAADRGNETVAYLSHPSDPAVVRLVDATCRFAREGGVRVCVCGESAADPVMAVLWVGLGADELSMGASCIPVVKKVLRAVTREEARSLAAEVLAACATEPAMDIYGRCRDFLLAKVPDFEELRKFFAAG